jgi:hypothetical protein
LFPHFAALNAGYGRYGGSYECSPL